MGWWLAIGLVVLLVGGIYLSVWDRNLATVEAVGDSLVITPRGFNKFWAFKREIKVPLVNVKSVRVVEPRELPWGWKVPGTDVPGLIRAGSYTRKGEWSFYLFRGGRPVVLIELDGNRFSRIGVETADPNGVATNLNKSLGDRQGSF